MVEQQIEKYILKIIHALTKINDDAFSQKL